VLLLMIASGPEMVAWKVQTIARGENMDARRAAATAWLSIMIMRELRGLGRDLRGLRANPLMGVPFAGGCVPASDGRVPVADDPVLVALNVFSSTMVAS